MHDSLQVSAVNGRHSYNLSLMSIQLGNSETRQPFSYSLQFPSAMHDVITLFVLVCH